MENEVSPQTKAFSIMAAQSASIYWNLFDRMENG